MSNRESYVISRKPGRTAKVGISIRAANVLVSIDEEKPKAVRPASGNSIETMNIGATAPDFTLPDGEGNDWTLSDHRGEVVVLMFYPGDDTPVCTKEMCSVRDHWSEYQQSGAEVVGISTDSVESKRKFAEKYSLPLRLLADEKGEVRDKYGAKSWLPGRTSRSEFVIDPQGKIAYQKIRPIGLFRPADNDILAAIEAASK